jgi:hypothetical protein
MKQFNQFCKYLLFAVGCMYLASCYGPKKAHLREVLDSTKLIQQAQEEQLKLATQKQEQAFTDERIDTAISNRITQRLNRYSFEIDSVNKEIAALEEKLENAKAFRHAYDDSIKPKIASLEERKKDNQLRLKKFTMLNEALDISRQNPFDLAAFFGPGRYNIPQENYSQASEMFLPAIDSLILFSNKYADIKRTSTLVVNGYADGQNVDTASGLFQTLLQTLEKNEAEKKELNQALSKLRAKEISNLLGKLLDEKKDAFLAGDKLTFTFFGYGQGETYPSKKITNYQENDERRRIVLIYWSVIPD